MQDNLYSFCSWYQENSGSHHSESAPGNSADSVDITSVSTHTGIPVYLGGWSSAVVPIIENSDSSLTALPGVAENFGCVAHASCHQTALGRAPPLPLPSCDYSTDAHLRPWWSAVQAETSHAPQTAWDERSVSLTQLNRTQVLPGTTDLDVFGKSWSQRGDGGQAVEAPAQPTSFRHADHPPHPIMMPPWSYMPAFPEDSARSISQAHTTGLSNVGFRSGMADPVLGHVPSLSSSNHRRRQNHRRPRQEHVICDKCEKPMRRQSLSRHIREVHYHIKRSHAKSSFGARS